MNCEQQFFEQLTTSMMTPALIEDARKQLEAGKSVVVQLTRTNEAQAERETANAKKNDDGTLDLNETDFSCKGILEELVKNCNNSNNCNSCYNADDKTNVRTFFFSRFFIFSF